MKKETPSKIDLQVFDSRAEMGAAAGMAVEKKIVELLAVQKTVRVIFASAPSQDEVQEYLSRSTEIDWSRIVAFHLDEYIGLPSQAPQAFAKYLCERLFDKMTVKPVLHLMDGNTDAKEECRRYAELIKKAPIDVVCFGIGENGHIAFNDPSVADFSDPEIIKSVKLEMSCRQQQVNDGCFKTINAVPTDALTLTIPTILSGKYLFCVVPGPTKQAAVNRTLNGPVSTECPASILQNHSHCQMYLDRDSYGS